MIDKHVVKDPHIFEKAKYFLADKAYDSQNTTEFFEDNGIVPVIPQNKRNIKDKRKIKKFNDKQKKIYKNRNKVENSFAILKKIERY